jgi:hypothetical protein
MKVNYPTFCLPAIFITNNFHSSKRLKTEKAYITTDVSLLTDQQYVTSKKKMDKRP